MKKYAVVATPDEVKLIKRIPELKGVPIIITGVGASNIIEALGGVSKESWLVNVGYAGSRGLAMGECYKVGYVTQLHVIPYEDRKYVLDGDVDCYSSVDFVQSDKEGCLFDMELAFICALGFSKVQSYKFVSDTNDYKEYKNTLKKQSKND